MAMASALTWAAPAAHLHFFSCFPALPSPIFHVPNFLRTYHVQHSFSRARRIVPPLCRILECRHASRNLVFGAGRLRCKELGFQPLAWARGGKLSPVSAKSSPENLNADKDDAVSLPLLVKPRVLGRDEEQEDEDSDTGEEEEEDEEEEEEEEGGVYYDEFSDDGEFELNEADAEAGVVLKMSTSEKRGKDRGRLMELCAKVQASGERTVTAGDIADLYDFPFDKFQRMSIEGLLKGSSLVACAPTSSGKTFVAEAAAAATIASGIRLFYTTPLKALSNQKLREDFLRGASVEEDTARLQTMIIPEERAEYSNRTGNACEEETEALLSSGAKVQVDNGINVELETLNLLEWPKVCVQVSEFASTPMAVDLARAGSLPIGKSVAECEELQAQTAAAQLLSSPLDFSEIADLRGFIKDAQCGNVCQLDELCQVRKTLAAMRRLHQQVIGQVRNGDVMSNQKGDQGSRWMNSLQRIMFNCNLCSDLEAAIDHCLDCSRSTVLDRASPKLASIRLKRFENSKALEALIKETAAMVFSAGGMDAQLVTKRRGRLCVAIRASQKGLLKNGVTLDVSNSGATYFMEPEPAIHFNNEEIQLSEEEKLEEIAVLRRLTFMLLGAREDVVELLERIVAVDLACARAGHSAWLNAARPVFVNNMVTSEPSTQALKATPNQGGVLLVDIQGVRHPLLLGSALASPVNALRYGICRQKASSTKSSPSVKDAVGRPDRTLPVPIDIAIRRGVKVVTITGPNTGGKTATLKTLGIVTLMAKAGLCLPASGTPRLPWFDCILADIGDDQSLERSLSTFSGHIRRVRQILEAGTSQSLVLLDEIGGGTDPSEGAALATAILRSLGGSVRLTLATTHCAELRTLKDQDSEFENASVEFDIKTLRPTYRVLWGIAGQSNALNIAESLGLDAGVITRARELVTKLVPASLGARSTELMVPLVKQRDEQRERAVAAAAALELVSKVYDELQSEVQDLAQKVTKLRLTQEDAANADVVEANAKLEEIMLRFQESTLQNAKDEDVLSMRDAQAAIAAVVEEYATKPVASITSGSASGVELAGQAGDGEPLRVGEQVMIKRLGKRAATVVEVPQAENDYLTVQAGTMKMRVKLNEIVSRVSSAEKEVARNSSAKKPKQPVRSGKLKRAEASMGEEVKYDVAVQTSKNTLDLRGQRVEGALQELEMALASRAPQSVLFVVHGMGTGAVKEAVWLALKKHRYVARFEQENVMNPGCTIVYIK